MAALPVVIDTIRRRLSDVVVAQASTAFLWLPVAFGAGAATWLYLPFQPILWMVLAPTVLLAGGCLFIRRFAAPTGILIILNLVFAFSAGMSVCALRSQHVQAPVLSSDRSTYRVDAFVVDDLSPSSDRPRLLLAPIRI
ncbi:MAG: hypothetical protein JF571_09710, partial [Asticcacaulis sp.]|nr:hypothetical protein [Asticcacaulis sp.]